MSPILAYMLIAKACFGLSFEQKLHSEMKIGWTLEPTSIIFNFKVSFT